jgi:hypothetical protein
MDDMTKRAMGWRLPSQWSPVDKEIIEMKSESRSSFSFSWSRVVFFLMACKCDQWKSQGEEHSYPKHKQKHRSMVHFYRRSNDFMLHRAADRAIYSLHRTRVQSVPSYYEKQLCRRTQQWSRHTLFSSNRHRIDTLFLIESNESALYAAVDSIPYSLLLLRALHASSRSYGGGKHAMPPPWWGISFFWWSECEQASP